MNKKDIILYASIAGGAYLAYWYVTHYGPNGLVSAGSVSYWDTWFGASTPTTSTTTPLTDAQKAAAALAAQQAACVAPNQWTNNACVAPANTPPSQADLVTKLLQAANAPNNGIFMNADQWNYYRNIIAPPALTPAQFGTAFPELTATNRGTFTADMFVGRLHSAGLAGIGGMGYLSNGMGDVIPVPSRPSVPMMSFGGALNPAFPGKKGWA